MTTMRVSVLRGTGDVAVEEREVPEPAAGEVLVEIGSVGVCGSDVHYFEQGRIGPHVVNEPLILGHEAGGVVTAVGAGVSSLQVGQRVSIEPGVPRRSCAQCLAGAPPLRVGARASRRLTYHFDGGFPQDPSTGNESEPR